MVHKRSWLVYVVIRLLAFVVPFAAVMLALPAWQFNWLAGALVGTVVGLCVSYIFLRPQRETISGDIAGLRGRRDTRTADERDEDDAVDAAAAASTAAGADATAGGTAGDETPDADRRAEDEDGEDDMTTEHEAEEAALETTRGHLSHREKKALKLAQEQAGLEDLEDAVDGQPAAENDVDDAEQRAEDAARRDDRIGDEFKPDQI